MSILLAVMGLIPAAGAQWFAVVVADERSRSMVRRHAAQRRRGYAEA